MTTSLRTHSPWMVLVTVMLGTLLIGIDRTVVNLALPKMIDDFGITVSSAGWIATAYIIANAVFVPVFGKLGDMLGNRKIYLWSFIGFTITSMLAGLSWNLSSMIVFRILQGLTGAAVYPTAMSLIAKSFADPKDRAQALGVWTASFAASAVIGPLIGGPLIDHYSWRMLFYINLPIGILGVLMVLAHLPTDRGSGKGAFDVPGATTLAIALSSLVLVLEKGQEWGWLAATSITAYALVVIFTLWFIHLEKHHHNPIIDLTFFTNRTFVVAILVSFISFGGMMGSMFLIPVFVQIFLGYNATQTGLMFLPMALTMFVAAPIGGILSQKVPIRYSVACGMGLIAYAIHLYTGIDAKTTHAEITTPLMILAVGMGLGMAPLTNAITSSVATSEVGVASAVLNLARNIAGAVGIALFSTLLTNATNAKVLEVGAYTIINDASYTSVVATLAILKAQILAYREVFAVASLIALCGALVALALPDIQRKKSTTQLDTHAQ